MVTGRQVHKLLHCSKEVLVNYYGRFEQIYPAQTGIHTPRCFIGMQKNFGEISVRQFV